MSEPAPRDAAGEGPRDARRGRRRGDSPTDDGPRREPHGEPASAAARSLLAWPLWVHAAVLAAGLVLVLAIARPQAVVVPDEGLYLAQAHALADGSWDLPRHAPGIDDDGALSRLLPEAVLGEEEVAYARHAAYPLVITPGVWLAGYAGALAMSMLGLWGAAVAAALVARRIDARLAVPALWTVGIASPLLFYGFLAVGHALAAATAGFAMVGITRWLEDRSAWGLALGATGLAATVLLRSEGTILALAVALTVCLLSIASLRPPRVDLRALLTGMFLGLVTVGAYVADTRVADAITGRDGYGVNPATIAMRSSADPVAGSWASLLRPFGRSPERATLWVVAAAVGLIGASVVLRVAPRRVRPALGLAVLAGTSAVVMVFDPPALVTGLLPAFPLLAAGLVWLHRSDMADPMLARVVTTVLIAAGGIVATLYANGGAAEWGGRFFGLLVPLLVPLAVLGLSRAGAVLEPAQRRLAAACAVLVVLALSSSALRTQADLRSDALDTVEGTFAHLEEDFGSDPPLVVVARQRPSGNSRLFWDTPEGTEVLTTIGLERIGDAIEPAAAAGRDRLLVVTDADPRVFDDMAGEDLEGVGWEVLERDSTPRGTSNLVLVGDPRQP